MKGIFKRFGIVLFVSLLFLIVIGCSQNGVAVKDNDTTNDNDTLVDYPRQAITCVVPFGPGSVTDLTTRVLMEEFSKKLGGNIIIKNSPGGGTIIGHTEVAKAKPDGYTIGIGAFAVEISLATTKAEINNLDDLDVIAQMAHFLNGIAVSTDSPWETLDDLGKWGKENPGGLIVAPSATGSITHSWWELIAKHYEIEDFGLLATEGGNDAALRLLAGDADVISTPLNNIMEHVDAGTMRVLAVTATEKVEGLPDAPTLEEVGIENPMIHNYLLIAPKGLPEGVRKLLLDTARDVLQDPEIQRQLRGLWMKEQFLTGDELKQQTDEGRKAMSMIIEAMNK